MRVYQGKTPAKRTCEQSAGRSARTILEILGLLDTGSVRTWTPTSNPADLRHVAGPVAAKTPFRPFFRPILRVPSCVWAKRFRRTLNGH